MHTHNVKQRNGRTCTCKLNTHVNESTEAIYSASSEARLAVLCGGDSGVALGTGALARRCRGDGDAARPLQVRTACSVRLGLPVQRGRRI